MIGRRDFILALGGAAVWPVKARAQQPAQPVVGYLGNSSFEAEREFVGAFHRGLAETGYVEGRNVAIEYRWADDHNDRLPALAAELVHRQVAVIAAPGATQSALVAKAATQIIPIVFELGTDPVEIGLVASFNRPGGNLTGVSELNVDMAAKRLELLHELVPAATSMAFLANLTNPVVAAAQTKELQAAARTLGLRLVVLNASDPQEFEGGSPCPLILLLFYRIRHFYPRLSPRPLIPGLSKISSHRRSGRNGLQAEGAGAPLVVAVR